LATFIFIRGAGDVGWHWHLVEAELRSRGHDTLAPGDDDSAGLPEYADSVSGAVGDRTDLIVAAQSRGGFKGGHTPALSRPRELADRLEACAADQGLLGDN
jgi:hypothetical protein